MYNTAKEFLSAKRIFGLDTKKRYEEVISWMEEYATQRDKEIAEQGWDACQRRYDNPYTETPDKQTFLSQFKTEA